MSKIIELIVAPDGTSSIETKGFTGADCKQASRFLETTLGLLHSEQLTAEFYSGQSSRAQIQEGRPS
jgi:hypothetical protein